MLKEEEIIIIQIEQVLYRYIHTHTYEYMCVTTLLKVEVMNLKDSKEGYMRGF